MGGPSKTLLRPSDAQERKKLKKVTKMTPKSGPKTVKKKVQKLGPEKGTQHLTKIKKQPISLKLSKEQPKTKIGFLELSWALLGLSWASLGLSWALLASLGLSWTLLGLPFGLSWGSLGPLLGSLGPLLGLPKAVQKGSQKGTPKKSALEPIFCEFWAPRGDPKIAKNLGNLLSKGVLGAIW